MGERAARIHRSQQHKLAEFSVERCPKCNSDQMAIEETMRGGTARNGEPMVWFRCATCRSLAMTRAT
jgi:uncharacterized protein with PIN domain